IKDTLNKSLREYHRTMILRIDLRLPENSPYEKDSTLITRFMESLKSQKNADRLNKISLRKRTHHCRIRYVWVREFNNKGKKHYHLALFFNQEAYAYPGTYKPDHEGKYRHNLAYMIMEAWVRVLHLDQEESYQQYYRLIQFPDNCHARLNMNGLSYQSDYAVIMNRLSYLAKEYSKDYSDGKRNFGCSIG
ncbi:inovirus Gp2 family protein, partial [Salmonella enterica]|nr:inovirus Gp2 family protein [Salmonella enterica]